MAPVKNPRKSPKMPQEQWWLGLIYFHLLSLFVHQQCMRFLLKMLYENRKKGERPKYVFWQKHEH